MYNYNFLNTFLQNVNEKYLKGNNQHLAFHSFYLTFPAD